ncbi:benzyl alcohol dehydrogenase [Klebsiella pneumoniae subsp. ozaenae]|uniref:Benzyl alcohol dehydrogenase n=1 Tax=Klebsiella pneumoniae subsp. ozaenae TaxID=574 RepID=A0A377ZL87_KLEPO|nr:benzyl alcohol dehydrogenase [Klebsiella pneumoniae subsp. ozaenae]
MQVKAAVTLGYQQPFVIKDVEVAPPGKDEILVKIVATGVCHTDAVMRDNPGVVPMPAILGHEGAGIVASVGEAVSGIKVGDHVVLSYAACHHCENCLSNHPSACEDFNTLNFGGRREDGTHPPTGWETRICPCSLASRLSASMWSPAPATRSWSTRRLISPCSARWAAVSRPVAGRCSTA